MYYYHNNNRLQSRIADLELLNGNFMSTTNNSNNNKSTSSSSERSAQTSTVNVAYIRNVLTKLLETKDREQKQIMINALLTALNSF